MTTREELVLTIVELVDEYCGNPEYCAAEIKRLHIQPLKDALARVEGERDSEGDFHRRVDEAFAVMECISQPEEIPGLWQDWATEKMAHEAAEAKLATAEARIASLEEALRPFAAVAIDRNLLNHSDTYSPRPSRGRPNMADYRRARSLVSTIGEGEHRG